MLFMFDRLSVFVYHVNSGTEMDLMMLQILVKRPGDAAAIHHRPEEPCFPLHFDKFEGYASWQRRGSMLIDEWDYNSKTKGRPILSLQPVITGNLDFSLILRYEDGAPAPQNISRFLEAARFQGGRIDGFGNVSNFDSESAAKCYVRTGKWIVDRHDRLEGSMDPLQDLLSICALRERETVSEGSYPVMWSSATVGYALLSEPEVRDGFRWSDNGPVPSAFAEAMTGLVGLYSVHDARVTKIPFWESGFVQKDVYLVRGKTQFFDEERN